MNERKETRYCGRCEEEDTMLVCCECLRILKIEERKETLAEVEKGFIEELKEEIKDMQGEYYRENQRIIKFIDKLVKKYLAKDKRFGCGKIIKTYHNGTLNCGDFEGTTLCDECENKKGVKKNE